MSDKKSGQVNIPSMEGQDFSGQALPEKIGKSLQQMYDEVLSEDVPDDFLALLEQADKKRAK